MTSEHNQEGTERKKLLRSDAIVGDDDNKLRASGKLSSFHRHSSSASQSRDSSYTDSTGTNLLGFITTTLHKNEKDRNFLLNLEQKMKEFIEDQTSLYYKFEQMSSYDRMMVHRVAAFFGLDHNIDQTGSRIVINKSTMTRKPEIEFKSLIRDNKYFDKVPFSRRGVQSFDEGRLVNYSVGNLVGYRPRMSTESPVGPGQVAVAAAGVRRAHSFEVGEWHGPSFGPLFMQSMANVPSNTSSSGGSSYQLAAFTPTQFGQPSPGYTSFTSPSIGSEVALTSADITVSPIPESISHVSPAPTIESGAGISQGSIPQTPVYIWPYYGQHQQYYNPANTAGVMPNCSIFQPNVPPPISYTDVPPGNLYMSGTPGDSGTGTMFYPATAQPNLGQFMSSQSYSAVNSGNQSQFHPSQTVDSSNISLLANQLVYQMTFSPQLSCNTASLGNVNRVTSVHIRPQFGVRPQFPLRRALSSPGKRSDYYTSRRDNTRRYATGTDANRRRQPRNRHATDILLPSNGQKKDPSDSQVFKPKAEDPDK